MLSRIFSVRRFRAPVLATAALVGLVNLPASAALITDPAGDFLPSYTGPKDGDLDVVSAQVFFNGSDFMFTSTMNGLIGTTTGVSYVWGIDRGKGAAAFTTIAPGVTFDSVFVLGANGTGAVHDLINGTNTTISDVTISGSTISGDVPLSALVSEGLAPADYMVNLWPKTSATGLGALADFAPDNSDVLVTSTATPEPASMGLVGLLLLAGAPALRRLRK